MDCIQKCLAELYSNRDRIDEVIRSLERYVAGEGPRRGRKPKWLAETEIETEQREPVVVKKGKPGRRKGKRVMSEEGKLAIRAGVLLRNWKASHTDASDEEVAKQRERFVQQLKRQ
ncbi:MAG: hypothetical protein JNK87_33635 [Bryobacterales bacterium]|nr:hypothetical protein [Bryobacterales bacterium]